MPPIRTFVSIPLPREIRDAAGVFGGRARPLFPAARWERPDKLHLTMKFLGETDDRLVPEILAAIAGAAEGVPPFTLVVSGFGAFPSLRRPRILWIGCEDAGGTLTLLHRRLEDRIAPLGFERDDRAFHPHVTIARIRGDGVGPHLTTTPKYLNFDAHHALVTEISLMKSSLQPGGSEYAVIGSCTLT